MNRDNLADGWGTESRGVLYFRRSRDRSEGRQSAARLRDFWHLCAACVLVVGCISTTTSEKSRVPIAPQAQTDPELKQATEGSIRMIRAFAQGDAGNCASIGVIKAALYEYGDNLTIERSDTTEGRLDVTLRNGDKVSITAEERAKASQLSRFKSGEDDGILTRANELFILMAKRLQLKRRLPTIDAAAEDLNAGEYFADTPELLGISGDVVRIDGNLFARWFKKTAFVRRNSSCVAASKGHAWFVSHGFADHHGTTKRFSTLFSSWYSFKATNVYCLVRQPPKTAPYKHPGAAGCPTKHC